jgi:hypothetical protein
MAILVNPLGVYSIVACTHCSVNDECRQIGYESVWVKRRAADGQSDTARDRTARRDHGFRR